MNNKKHFLSLFALLIFSILFYSSATSKKLTPLIVPDFSFSPPSTAAPGSAGLKIALISPYYSGNFLYSTQSPFNNFRISLGRDLEQILTAKGYTIKGPYDEYDIMTYSDKEECELGLFSDIDLQINQTSGGWDNITALGYPTINYRFRGTITISGKVTFYISETYTRQKLIVKSLSIPQQINIQVESEKVYAGSQSIAIAPTGIPIEDAGIHNPIAISLVDFYKSTMKRTWDLLPKEDLLRVKDQVPQIRKEAGFIKR